MLFFSDRLFGTHVEWCRVLSRLPRCKELPERSGSKLSHITDAPECATIDDSSLTNLLLEQRSLKQDRLVIADWLTDLGRSRLRSLGRFFETAGYSMYTPLQHFLYPEETLFLAELGHIQVRLDETPLSLQELFRVVLGRRQLGAHTWWIPGLCAFGARGIRCAPSSTGHASRCRLRLTNSGMLNICVACTEGGRVGLWAPSRLGRLFATTCSIQAS